MGIPEPTDFGWSYPDASSCKALLGTGHQVSSLSDSNWPVDSSDLHSAFLFLLNLYSCPSPSSRASDLYTRLSTECPTHLPLQPLNLNPSQRKLITFPKSMLPVGPTMFLHCDGRFGGPPSCLEGRLRMMAVSPQLLGCRQQTALCASLPQWFPHTQGATFPGPLLPQGLHPKTDQCGNTKASPVAQVVAALQGHLLGAAELSAEAALCLNSLLQILLPSLPSHRDPKRIA